MFKAVLFLLLFLPGVSCLISQASAEKTQHQPANTEIVDVLLKYGKWAPFIPSLNEAMRVNDINAVKILIEHGADINTRRPIEGYSYKNNINQIINEGPTVLEAAIERSDKGLIKYFTKKGADPHLERKISLLIFAISPSFTQDGCPIVIEAAGEPYLTTCTAMYQAVRSKDIEILSLLIDGGADINKICYKHQNTYLTPLQVAIRHDLNEVIELLLAKGAKI